MNSYSDESLKNRAQIPAGYDEDPNEITISFKNVWRILRQKMWVMIVSAIVCGLGLFLALKIMIPPVYTIKSLIYLQPNEVMVDDNGKIGTFEKKIINNALYIVENEDLFKEMAEISHYETSQEIKESIELLAYGEADMLEVNISGDTAKEAYQLSTTFLDGAVSLLKENIPYADISVIQQPVEPEEPSNKVTILYAVIGAFLGLIISFMVLFYKGLKDNRMQSREEAEEYLGKPVYAVLPRLPEKGKK